ncbi:transcription elongation factor SPT6 [Plasmodium brasilianum]|uniref:Transcription elongation factor SPT6 n=1 Tax=Plasmodium brasilianum TaxID=5824 RepID=A0ACB9Y487_PLABR|nr:transcription elongation factor SPT6 [Plasmodium brasilianum]
MQVIRNEKDTKHRRLKKMKNVDDNDLYNDHPKNDNENKIDHLKDKDYFIDDSETSLKKQKGESKSNLFNYEENMSDTRENENEEEEEEEGYPMSSDNIYKTDSYIHEMISQTFGDVNTVLDIINISPVKKKKKYDYENDEDEEDYEEDQEENPEDLFSKDMILDDEDSSRIKKKKKKRIVSFFDEINENLKKKGMEEDSDYEVDLDKAENEKYGDGGEDGEIEQEEDDEGEEEEEEEGEDDDEEEEDEEDEDEEGDDEADEGDSEEGDYQEEESDNELYEEEYKKICGEEYEDYDDYCEYDEYAEVPYYEDEMYNDEGYKGQQYKDEEYKDEVHKDETYEDEIYEGDTHERKKKKKVLSIMDEDALEKSKDTSNLFNDEAIIVCKEKGKKFMKRKKKKKKKKKKIKKKSFDIISSKWKTFAEPDETLNQLLTRKDDLIRYSDIPERYYFTYKKRKFKMTKKFILIESKWIVNKLKEKYPNYFTYKNFEKIIEENYDNIYDDVNVNDFLCDNFLLKKCILILNMMIKYKNEIPFIFFHKSYLIYPPFNLNMVWDIHELDKVWYKNFIKIKKLKSKLKILNSKTYNNIHSSVFDIMNKYNEMYYEDVNIYYYYIKNNLINDGNNQENTGGILSIKDDKDLYDEHNKNGGILHESRGGIYPLNNKTNEDNKNEQKERKDNNINEKKYDDNANNESDAYLKEDLFGDSMIEDKRDEEEEEEERKGKNKEMENEKEASGKKSIEEKGSEKKNNEKSIPGLLFVEYVKKNKFNVWDDYLLTTEQFYENISYMYDLIKNEKISPTDEEDSSNNNNNGNLNHYGDSSKSKRYPVGMQNSYSSKVKDKNEKDCLTIFKFNCSKIKNIVTNVPDIYGNDMNIQNQVEDWCRSFFSREVANNKDIFKTLICYYSKLLASHPGIKYILRFFFLKYASLTTVSTNQAEVHVDVCNTDYLAYRLYRFPVHHLLNYSNTKKVSTNSGNNSISMSGNNSVINNDNKYVTSKQEDDTKRNRATPFNVTHDPCYVHNYNVDFFNTQLDESGINIDSKKRELEDYYNMHRYKHIYLEILKNKENKLVHLIIHPILPHENVPWKSDDFNEREKCKKKKKKKNERDLKSYFEREKNKLMKSEILDNEWINNILQQLSYAYCYNCMENNNMFVYIQKKILNNFLCVELLPLFKKNLENLLLASAQNWLMVYIHQSFYLTLNVKPIKIFKKLDKKLGKKSDKKLDRKLDKELEEEKRIIKNRKSSREIIDTLNDREDEYSSDYNRSKDSYTKYHDEDDEEEGKEEYDDDNENEKKRVKKNNKKNYYTDESYSSDQSHRDNKIRKEEKKNKIKKSKKKINHKTDEKYIKNSNKSDLFNSSYSSDNNSYILDDELKKKKKKKKRK